LENPEAHLHPKGQSAIGELLALTADDGVQVLVESHSDHLLNGIRMAVKQEKIKPEDVALRYFLRRDGDQCSMFECPQVDARGRIDHWPDGFFDEWERSLMELV
jgi:predicted ATPase